MIRWLMFMFLSLPVSPATELLQPVPPAPIPYRILLPAARDANLPSGIPVRKLFDEIVRDPNITAGPDGMYYMVATTNPAPGYTTLFSDGGGKDTQMWHISDGIRMWRSPDMVHWEALGLVWSLDKDATWAHWYKGKNPGVTVWAPEIHYLNGTWWIPYCATPQGHEHDLLPKGLGLLKSISGRPEGPYRDVKADRPLGLGLDATLFQDDDGSVYYLYNGYNIASMKGDMSDFAETPREVNVQPGKEWGEGVFLLKVCGRYILTNSGTSASLHGNKVVTTYDSYAVTSTESPYGPYTGRYRALPHAGHNNYFQDHAGHWWSSYFGAGDFYAPWTVQPGVIPVEVGKDGTISAKRLSPLPDWKYSFSKPAPGWSEAQFNDRMWQTGAGGFGERAIMNSGSVSFVNTAWTKGEIWVRRSFPLSAQRLRDAELYLRHTGNVEVYLNGKLAAKPKGGVDDYVVQPVSSALLRAGTNVIAVHEAEPAILPTPVFADADEKKRLGQGKFPAYRYLDVGLIEKR